MLRKWLPCALLLLGLILLGGEWTLKVKRDTAARAVQSVTGDPPPFAPVPLLDRSVVRVSSDPSGPDQSKPLVGEAVLMEKMSRETHDLSVVSHPDGRRSLSLGGRFMMMSAVVTAPDGTTKVQCFSNYDEMKSALSGAAGVTGKTSTPTHVSY